MQALLSLAHQQAAIHLLRFVCLSAHLFDDVAIDVRRVPCEHPEDRQASD